MRVVDLNADLGEGMAGDAALLRVVTSANVACGGHAGDEATMRQILSLARQQGVTVGAHPGWPDRAQFGRQRWDVPLDVLRDTLRKQIQELVTLASGARWPLQYLKLHGAMANQVAVDAAMADVVAAVVQEAQLGWLIMPLTEMYAAARRYNVSVRLEAFADRTYTSGGLLTPRDEPGAVLHDADAIAARAVVMLERQALPLQDGRWLPTRIDSLCVHGDTADALTIATTLRQRVQAAGWQVTALCW